MTDAFETPLEVGDQIAYIQGYTGSRRYLTKGYVIALSNKRVGVGNLGDKYPSWIKNDKVVKL